MRTAAGIFWTGIIAFLIFASGGISGFGASAPARTLNLPEPGNSFAVEDDVAPEVTDRVARVSFIRGDAQIRRAGVDDWEKATLNLPVVEGDEIVTESGGRVEIQFDNHKHLRLAENSFLKIVNLKDEGIAVSLSLGTLNLRITPFDKDKSYFEIDAPKTTIAVQRAGTYRVDAGKAGDAEIRVAAMDGGEARVYSDNAGFTLKNGRSSRIFIAGPTSGEWETFAASRSIDEFDEWSSDRDSVIAKRLKDAYYDRYYDQDIYGADDLNDYGAWVHTRDYGYVWRPHRSSISGYADWSPYRYGHWRWMPPYGWIWVNDEPWGWATYHHGRWIWHGGYWNWSPYGYYRTSRSWWRPALVVISIFNNNVCWYPLGYRYRYNNYNAYYYNPVRNNTNPSGGITPIPSPTPSSGLTANSPMGIRGQRPPLGYVPAGAVVSVSADEFGTKSKGNRTPPLSVANAVLAGQSGNTRIPGSLPVYKDLRARITGDIKSERPRIDIAAVQAKAGAALRKGGAPLDTELRVTRVLGGRPPLPTTVDNGGSDAINNGRTEPRRTGAVDRPPVVKQNNEDRPVRPEPVYTPPARVRDEPKNDTRERPRYDPPPVRDTPRYEPPPRTEKPRNDPPPARQPPRSEPPPAKSEPKPDSTPSRPERGNKPDGR